MKRKKREIPLIENILSLFGKRLETFSGESKRSYQKAYSSLQLFLIRNYQGNDLFDKSVVENWVADNIRQGLSGKTVAFYLDKISSLYSGIAGSLSDGKVIPFKEIKQHLRDLSLSGNLSGRIKECGVKIVKAWEKARKTGKDNLLVNEIMNFSEAREASRKDSIKYVWGCLALEAGIRPNIIKGILGDLPTGLNFLDLCQSKNVSEKEREEILSKVAKRLQGEAPQWFAMRLRPKVKYDGLLDRFAKISPEVEMPELFYPSEEIAKRVGTKMVWKGKPVIRDVVFFKMRRNEVYSLFRKLYDLAWCYRNPGIGKDNYATIPDRAMEDFKKALGILQPGFEIAPAGEMKLRPGDEVIIVNGDYANTHAKIIRESTETEDGNKIFRVTLLNQNGHWDIGIDARWLKLNNS